MNNGGKKEINWMMGLIIALSGGCKRHYSPPAITAPNNYLVVEGVIAAGFDSTIINLSRSVNISQQVVSNPERGATVSVESDQNDTYPLAEVDTGKYGAAPLNLNAGRKYRLHIVTADGRIYESDFEPVVITPPMDTLAYNTDNNGVNVYINTHDATNNTHYYRWDYTETYIYLSTIQSYYIFDDSKPDLEKSVLRTADQQVHTCYVTQNASTILLNSTAALNQSVIQNYPITEISKYSEKVFHRYSIIVKEYALTPEAYQFWSVLQRNSQNIGTIFDVQPSEVKSNLHCVSNPAEPVIGYMSVSSISQKRIFIDRTELPVWPYMFPHCDTSSRCWKVASPADPDLVVGNVIPIEPVMAGKCGTPLVPGYTVSVATYDCVDCRYHLHGVTTKPSFWK